ncbi:hypothetical protein K5B43_000684 [Vibrio parahaemolyticus]|nr:hypothetical protein [Vibrio parahaemolyticus]
MKPLSHYQRNAVLYLLKQQKHLAKPVSFATALKVGVTEEQIRIIDYVSHILNKAPYLTQNELKVNGFNQNTVHSAIGSLTEFKEQLGLSEYGFSDWLISQEVCYSRSQSVAIPYLIYQMFFEEIKEFHSKNNILSSGLEVELGSGYKYSSVSLFGNTDVLIPTTDKGALHLAASLLSESYWVHEIDEDTNSLNVERMGSSILNTVEVRCLSSNLTKSTYGGIYIYDDVQLATNTKTEYTSYPLAKLIDRHHARQPHTTQSQQAH